MLRSRPVAPILISLVVLSTEPLLAAPFTNGSFEVGPSIPSSGWTNLGAGSTSITGWTVRPSDIDYTNGSYQTAEDGNCSLDLSGNAAGGIEQTFDTVQRVSYAVSFYMAGNPDAGSTLKGLDVGATGNPTAHYTFSTSGHSRSALGWQQQKYIFVAVGPSTTLFFQSTDASNAGPTLDNVSVYALKLPSGAVAYYPAEGDANDVVGGHNGVLRNGATFGPGVAGNAFLLDGIDDFVSVVDDGTFNFGAGPFSVSAWFKTAGGRSFNEHIFGKGLLWTGSDDYVLWVAGGDGRVGLQYLTPGAGDLVSTTRGDDNNWHQVVVTESGTCSGCMKLYLDGRQEATNTGRTLGSGADPFIIGAVSNPEGHPFKGSIDELTLFNRSLSAGEIQCLYQQYTSLSAAVGAAVQTASNYESSIAQGAQQTNAICMNNVSAQARTVTSISVVNPSPGLTMSISPSSGLTIPAGQAATANLTIQAAANTTLGRHGNILLAITTDDGNAIYSTITVFVQSTTQPLPDLSVGPDDITVASNNSDGTTTFTVIVHNGGSAAASGFHVQLYDFETTLLGDQTAAVGVGGVTGVSFTATLSSGEHVIRAAVDPTDVITELDEANNQASKLLRIGSLPVTQSGILVTGSAPTTVYTNSPFTISGLAQYDLVSNGVSNTTYVVKGGLAQITLIAPGGGQSIFGSIHTATTGSFTDTVQAPTTKGNYSVVMTVTDQTLTGTRQLPLSVVDPPPTPPAGDPGEAPPSGLAPHNWGGGGYVAMANGAGAWTWNWEWTPGTAPSVTAQTSDLRLESADIHFSSDNPSPNQDVTIFAQIHFWASTSTQEATNVPVNVYIKAPDGTQTRIAQTVIANLAIVGPDYGARFVYATWRNAPAGVYVVEVEIDPIYQESVMTNNAATRAIIVGSPSSNLGTIAGHVLDTWGGLAGLRIDVLDSTGAVFAGTFTDTTGSYLVSQLPVGNYQVRLLPPAGETPDANPKPAAVAANAITVVDFQLAQNAVPVPALPRPFVGLCALLLAVAAGLAVHRRSGHAT